MHLNFRLLLVLSALAAVAAAQAQSFQGLYVETPDGRFAPTDANDGERTDADPFTATRQFTGNDRMGVQRTLTVTGSAYSYADLDANGKHALHLAGSGTVVNGYYNEDNTPVLNDDGSVNLDGSPYRLAMHGNTGYSDTLTFANVDAGAKVNFYFYLDGVVAGDTEAGLNFSTDLPDAPGYSPRTKRNNETWVTPEYTIPTDLSFEINVDMFAGLTTNLSEHADGTTYGGSANYGHTLVLGGIRVTENGQVVRDYSVTSTGGATYQAVPEPGTFAALGLGGLALLRRRRKA